MPVIAKDLSQQLSAKLSDFLKVNLTSYPQFCGITPSYEESLQALIYLKVLELKNLLAVNRDVKAILACCYELVDLGYLMSAAYLEEPSPWSLFNSTSDFINQAVKAEVEGNEMLPLVQPIVAQIAERDKQDYEQEIAERKSQLGVAKNDILGKLKFWQNRSERTHLLSANANASSDLVNLLKSWNSKSASTNPLSKRPDDILALDTLVLQLQKYYIYQGEHFFKKDVLMLALWREVRHECNNWLKRESKDKSRQTAVSELLRCADTQVTHLLKLMPTLQDNMLELYPDLQGAQNLNTVLDKMNQPIITALASFSASAPRP